jgi:ATPase subunit of ABC transporter with duplicated ATPase domains
VPGTLTAVDITRWHGSAIILDKVSLAVGPDSRLGVVGPNGIGKSTLLRILAGLEESDAGSVERSPGTLTVGGLAQEPDAQPGETLLEYLGRRTGVAQAEFNLDLLTNEMAEDPDMVDAYTDALDHFLALGGDDLVNRAAAVCADLGLPADRLHVPVGELSGGQAARAGLAAILLARFDVFLLDEPTNDLDFAGLDILEEFLAGVPGAVVVVSHDRAFLDRSVSRILEIEEETHRAAEFAGAWTEYVERRALAHSQQAEAHRRYTEERDRLRGRAREQRQWGTVGADKVKKRQPDNDKAQRDWKVNRTERLASKVKATERRLEQLERNAVDKPWEGWQLHLSLNPKNRSGDVVARLEEAVVQRGSFRLGPIDLEVNWQDRVAILGPNGSGKTTLLRAMLGQLPLASGRRYLGPGVVVGEMDQGRRAFSTDDTVLDAFVRRTDMLPEEARSLLAKFGLGAGHVARRGDALSPGERSRAILAALMATGVNCLVLDEPTNHLDLAGIEQLEEALESFDGTLLLVTHDRWLLETVELTRTIDLTGANAA